MQVYDPTVGFRINTTYIVGTGAGQADCTTVPGECSITPAVSLNAVPNQWWRVRGNNAYGSGPYSSMSIFSVVTAVPGTPILVAPADASTVTTATPTYRWSATTGTVQNYRLVVINGAATEVLNALYTPAALGCSSGGTCSVTPGTALTNGGYTWHVRAENIAGPGSYSTTWSFTVAILTPPSAPTPLAPLGPTAANPVTYRWTHTGGTSYSLQEYDPTVGFRINTTYAVGTGAGQANCTAVPGDAVPGECSITPAVTLNAVPNQWWRVRGNNAAGSGTWGVMTLFTVN